MVQNLRSEVIPAGHKTIVFEKPLFLCRIFLSIQAIAPPEAWCESRISFDDPMFYSYYALAGYSKHFETKGEGISQGDVWVINLSTTDVLYAMTEILVQQH